MLALALPGAAGADPTAGPPRINPLPIQVTFTEITPAISTGDEPITITAELTNTGSDEITDPWIRLQRDQRVSNRAAMNSLDDKQPSYTSSFSAEVDLDITLEPGATETVELTVTRHALALYDTGVYPIMLNVQGSINGMEGRVGQAAFAVPRTIGDEPPAISVSWVLPLIERPHRVGSADTFTDDSLGTNIVEGGRLERLLSAAEQYAEPAQLSLLVDPELIDALVAMSDGYQVRDGSATTSGAHADDAADFLERLTALAADTPIITTPYADVDVVALVRSGFDTMVTDAREYGEQVVADALDVEPITTVAWPADGIITEAALTTLTDDGVQTVLLSGSSFGQPDYLESGDGITENAATVLPHARAVVADPSLSRLLRDADSYSAGPVAAVQRITAELALIANQAPQRERNVLLLPPREWDPSDALLDALLERTTTAPWINPADLAAVAVDDPQDRGVLQYPIEQSNRELPATELSLLNPALTQITELSTAFDPEDAEQALGPIERTLYRATSAAWRGSDDAQISRGISAAETSLSGLRGQIRIVTPGGGTYTLASSEAPLVFTVENTLPWAVHYRIGIDESRSAGLSAQDIGVQTIPGGTRATVQLPTLVERSGSFTVVAQISTPEGKRLGNDVQINVSSSAYGTAALWVTGVAFTVLLALIARRWWRRRLFWADERRRRDAAEEHQRRERAEQAATDAAESGAGEPTAPDAADDPDQLIDYPGVAKEQDNPE